MRIYSKEDYRELDEKKFKLVQMDHDIKDEKFEQEPVGFFKDALIRFRQNKASVLAFFIICIVLFFTIFGPYMNSYGFNDQNSDTINMPCKIPLLAPLGICDGGKVIVNRRADLLGDPSYYPEGSILEVFNEREIQGVKMVDVKVDYYKYTGNGDKCFWFGTDYLGRDLWTRLWRGSRVSLLIAFVSVITNVFIGVIYGSIAGYYGGKVDMILMRITEIISALPRIVIITMFIMYFGTGLFAIIMALVVKGWVHTARMVRAQFYRFKQREYVLAARTLGIRDGILIFRHILPNAIGPIITSSMIAIPSAIFAESFLAYIGLGLQAPEPSIGVLLSQGQKVLLHYPNQSIIPGILISVLMISFNLFANGLRDSFDPTLRGA
ncbi:ABC transporter permease [Fusibacter ferrireducens]|uniref:ABC transporter permease n=1 Tax=Fusibacter ferrireducens TaxID=2785058 RepID=A0ABR9ZVH6_9FIRM|nr:ABC transporter permease [Fusibacter ferrireducens]MBF4694433.1 ABC transporter permease [Fusibacter ferrireducens]